MRGDIAVGVIEGDIATDLDAARLEGRGAQVSLLNTSNGFGGECHLDAPMVNRALAGLDLAVLDLVVVENVGNLVCPAEFDVGHPLISATLPNGARVQIVAPPATRGDMAFAFRKHVVTDLSLSDYEASGAFDVTEVEGRSRESVGQSVRALLDQRRISDALGAAVRGRLNILISGGTSTGKTTFLNALLREIPPEERLILIEDTPELRLTHANALGLIGARSELSESSATADDLVSASLRLRPDRIILGELRGREVFAFLRAINSGHPGSMTTVHADSPESAVEQIALLVLQTGVSLRREDVRAYIAASVNLFIQLERRAGKRRIGSIQLRADQS